MTITERVSNLLYEQGKSQAGLARYVGSTKSSVSYWFTKNGDIPNAFLLPICEYLNISPNYLLTGNPDPEPVSEPAPESEIEPFFEDAENAPAASKSALDEDADELVQIFQSLDREGRTMVLATAYTQRTRMLAQGENKESVTA